MKVSRLWATLALAGALPVGSLPSELSAQDVRFGRPAYQAQRPIVQQPAVVPADSAADPFLRQLDAAIEVTSRRYLTADVHTPWQIFHGILALKQDFLLKKGDAKISAIEWIATSDPTFDNEPWIEITRFGGQFHRFTRPYAFEGHPTQFLALLGASGLPADFEFKASRHEKIPGWKTPADSPRTVTIADMIENAKKNCNTSEEMTWTLWAFTYYVDLDAQWTSQWGEPWSMERLVQTQVQSQVNGAPCGGNHNLFALTLARDKCLAAGRPLTGVWLEADQKVKRYLEYARALQNPDGSFSAKFYANPGHTTEFNERLNTTGHTLEFVARALPEQRLHELWVRRAVSMLSQELINNRQKPADCGPLYHSLNALITYRNRVNPPKPKEEKAEVAVQPVEATAPEAEAPLTPPEPALPTEN